MEIETKNGKVVTKYITYVIQSNMDFVWLRRQYIRVFTKLFSYHIKITYLKFTYIMKSIILNWSNDEHMKMKQFLNDVLVVLTRISL
mgnify:CR=1 FL=1